MTHMGLTSKEVHESREQHGNNALTKKKRESFFEKLLDAFKDPIIIVLLIASAISLLSSILRHTGVISGEPDWIEVGSIIVAICIATFYATITEHRQGKRQDALEAETDHPQIKAYRDSQLMTVDIDNLVVGDIILLQTGDGIPADGLLIKGDLLVNNASLNGETHDNEKEAPPDNTPWDDSQDCTNKHQVYRGAVITGGEALVQIVHVGKGTLMGAMAESMNEEQVKSPMKERLAKLATQIAIFGYIGGFINAAVVAARGFVWYTPTNAAEVVQLVVESVSLGLVIIVMAVPEGLPLMIALVLALNMKKMLDEKIFVKKMVGIETAGNLEIVFSDKTGTITHGNLTVVEIFNWEDEHIAEHCDVDLVDEHTRINLAFNNNAKFCSNGIPVGGNATDRALLKFIGMECEIKLGIKITDAEVFNSKNKYSSITLEDKRQYFKGAPEVLIPRLEFMNKELEDYITKQAKKSRRILCLAYKMPDKDKLTLSGFVCITDPVRSDAIEAVHNLHAAGVHVMMVTGDRAETAIAVSTEAGFYREGVDLHYTDTQITAMSDEEIGNELLKITVVSRATPMTKLRLVNIAQAHGIVCGMTGDGVNDAPALNKADVGFAMGSGTEAAKDAGDVTILDDSLMSIKNAIWYGRTVFRNIQKFCRFQLTMNIAAVFCVFLPILFSLIFGFHVSVPLTIVQLLWINLIMDTLGAVAFGNEPHKEEYMEERPKKREAAIVDRPVFTEVVISGVTLTFLALVFLLCRPLLDFFEIEQYSLTHTTMFFTLFIFSSLINGLTIRKSGWHFLRGMQDNVRFMKIFAAIALIQIMFVTVLSEIDFFARALSLTPITMLQVGTVFIFALFMLPVKILAQKLVLDKH